MLSESEIKRFHLRAPSAGEGDLIWHAKRYAMSGVQVVDEDGNGERQIACVRDEDFAFRITKFENTGNLSISGILLSPDETHVLKRLDSVDILSNGQVISGGNVIADPSKDIGLSFLKVAFHVGYDLPIESYTHLDRLPDLETR